MTTSDDIYKNGLFDPVLEWRLAVTRKFSSGRDDPWWDVLLELEGVALNELLDMVERSEGLKGSLIVPDSYTEKERSARPDIQYPALYAKERFLRAINEKPKSFHVRRLLMGTIVPESQLATSAVTMSEDLSQILVNDQAVVIAVIDNGIAFGHEFFRKSDLKKSRIAFAWIMDAEPKSGGPVVPQGRALTQDQIDGFLAANISGKLLNEDRFYRQCGLIDFDRPGFKPASLRISHGTHVMGLAAGYEPGTMDDRRPIICVQLPTDITMDVSGTQILPSLGRAIDFIKKHAQRFRQTNDHTRIVPLVVNFSFGNFAGPHDGTGIIEAKIDTELAATAQHQIQVTLPAGNGNLARTHAEITFTAEATANGDPALLDWRIQPDDRTASYVEIWMPPLTDTSNLASVRVTPPGGPQSDPVTTTTGSFAILHSAQGEEVGRIVYAPPHDPTHRGCITICAHPTFHHDVTSGLAPSGVWKIEILNVSLTETDRLEVWIRRDETLPGFPAFGRQSYFDNDCYQRFDSYGASLPIDPSGSGCLVTRSGTLSGFACGERPSVLAGYVETSNRLADYSAAGPITTAFGALNPTRTGPDAAAVSDDTPVLGGILSAGSRSGSRVALGGSSVAAPQAARWIAERLAAGLSGDRVAVNAQAAADDAPPPPKPALTRVGGGRLERRVRFGPKRGL
ncbi:hypothetical protein [Roseibium sp.]|uniref:hypothetical protein n=1 Tax=Roseibium sp. TaxID=1936156 RepID=UPI003D136580